MVRAAIFARTSSEEQAAEGKASIPIQFAETRTFAEGRDWEVAFEVVEEGISGALVASERPGIQRLFELAGADEIEHVVFLNASRFARDFAETVAIAARFRDLGVTLWLTDQPASAYDPLMQEGLAGIVDVIKAAMAQEERRELKKKLLSARIKYARDGRLPGGVTKFGYVTEDGYPVVDPDQAPVVERMYSLALEHENVRAVARALDSLGYAPPSGRKWGDWMVRSTLTDERYCGRGYVATMGGFNDKNEYLGMEEVEIRIPYPALVDEATFDAVQVALAKAAKRYERPANYRAYALSSRIVHDHGDRFWSMRGEYRHDSRLYACSAVKDGDGCPGTTPERAANRMRRSVDSGIVEAYVIRVGLDLIADPNKVQEMADEATRRRIAAPDHEDLKTGIVKALANVESERTVINRQETKGRITEDEADDQHAELATRKAQLESDLATLDDVLDPSDLLAELLVLPISPFEPSVRDWAPNDIEWPDVRKALIGATKSALDGEGLADWAIAWSERIVEILDWTVVVQEDGDISARPSNEIVGSSSPGTVWKWS